MKAWNNTVSVDIESTVILGYQWGKRKGTPRMIEDLRLIPRKLMGTTNTDQGKIKKRKQSEEPRSHFLFLLSTLSGQAS